MIINTMKSPYSKEYIIRRSDNFDINDPKYHSSNKDLSTLSAKYVFKAEISEFIYENDTFSIINLPTSYSVNARLASKITGPIYIRTRSIHDNSLTESWSSPNEDELNFILSTLEKSDEAYLECIKNKRDDKLDNLLNKQI